MGDRECPYCEEDTLIEKGASEWVCLKCKETFSEQDLEGEELQ